MLWQWIVKIVVWALAGGIGCKLMKGNPDGLLSNIILGLLGGIVGGLLFSLLGLGSRGFIGDVLVSAVGACVVIWLVKKFDLGRFFTK